MINIDVIQWISKTIKNEFDTLSDYSLEYATALLMNLSLRPQGKLKCEHTPDILQTLCQLMEHENPQVRTHINGTLYSILTRTSLKE